MTVDDVFAILMVIGGTAVAIGGMVIMATIVRMLAHEHHREDNNDSDRNL